ncbi:hypothetical protein AAGS61_01680 [Lysinibacillus sp. KU-BSD001]|uniref:hypothetical protein n=1 Tax=Lysinibacillus sp. KU-BSD001 TaxID=3141328 RepID=UPI0036EB016B
MKGCLFLISKTLVMMISIFLITFIPTTENEFAIFCASRLALILLVCIDYIGVFINNEGVEKLIGTIGILVTFVLICFELLLVGNLVVPIENYTYISGNSSNYLTKYIPNIKIEWYLMTVFGSIIAMLGLETLNYSGKTFYNSLKNKANNIEDGIGEDHVKH